MSLTPVQQFQELVKHSSAPLILLPAYASGDAVGSAFALALFLKKLGKNVSVASDTIERDKESFTFLSVPDTLLPSISGARDFVLSFNTTHNKIGNVRTETTPDELRIYLTPEHGAIDPRDFSFVPARFKFDLVFVIGSPDKEHLGKIYEENPDIFYEVPIINIDNHSQNELFGQVNMVELTASSAAEIVTELLEKSEPDLIDEAIAESLLAGIIVATDSFQKKNTTPKALQLASRLMDKGADQQNIIRALYKTQPLHLLKLWGRVMAGIQWDEEQKLIWALVSLEDLIQSRSRPDDLPAILEKIKSNYASATYFLLLFPESTVAVRGIVKAATFEALSQLAERFREGTLHGDTFHFTVSATHLKEAEALTLRRWRELFPAPPGL